MTVEIIKGNPTPEQKEAIKAVFTHIGKQAEALRNRKPHPRGFYGSREQWAGSVISANPGGFRNPRIPG